ncbi:hypothetical protein EDB89DRAFT_2030899 [Lactarius sanguifluus]|nr:hypothetical protein EDB89DRAFT_2030899 [Lactarius sanguifluus]
MSFFLVSFCFFSHYFAAPLKSSPPRHMQVHGRRVHPSPSPPHHGMQDPSRGTHCAVSPALTKFLLHCAPQVLTATTALPHSSPWPPRSPFTTWESATPSQRARLVTTPRLQCHHNTATMPREIPLQH